MYVVVLMDVFFFFKQKTAYEMRISDWSSDVCSSDLRGGHPPDRYQQRAGPFRAIRIAIAMRSQRIEEAVERGKKHDRLCDARKAQPPGDVVGQRKEGEDQFLETGEQHLQREAKIGRAHV